MQCPRCRSEYLMIRKNTGFERLLVLLTGLREYRCRDCDQKFRAPDRRLRVRTVAAATQGGYAAATHRSPVAAGAERHLVGSRS